MWNLILGYYSYLNVFALILLTFRKDKKLIMDDLIRMVARDSVFLAIFSLLSLFIILPLTIPFSILNILKK